MHKWSYSAWVLVGLALFLAGCASNGAQGIDPHEHFNRKMDNFNDSLDRHILKPASDAYVKVIPGPGREALGNAFNNLTYFNVVVNDYLQGKAQQGSQDLLRMAFNSTVGLAGLLDVATPLHLKRHDQDFGLTLGDWGVKQGHYLVLPFYGPTTDRDMWRIPLEVVTDPLTWVGAWWQTLPVDAVQALDFRATAEEDIHFRNATALDPYVFTREAYLQYREHRLSGNNRPATQPALDYFENDTATQPATRPARQGAAPGK